VHPNQIVTAHNGIVLSDFAANEKPLFSRQPACFGTISRFAEEKGHSYLIEAFAMLAAQHIPARLKIAGSGRLLPGFRARVERLGLSDRIEFAGHVPSSGAFYREIDAFIVPSVDAEGLPTTILEAMASRLPVIATDVGGATEAVRDGREGLIVPPRDPRALANAIGRLLADSLGARRMGNAGFDRVSAEFTVEKMTETIVQQVYRPILAGVRPAKNVDSHLPA
jgi:glycosyltransferase involved in cell wall biosynthesis